MGEIRSKLNQYDIGPGGKFLKNINSFLPYFSLLLLFLCLMIMLNSIEFVLCTSVIGGKSWFWFGKGVYAIYESTGPVILFLNLTREDNTITLVNVIAYIKLSWSIIDIQGGKAFIRFNVTLYNISKAERWHLSEKLGMLKGMRATSISLPDPYTMSRIITINLHNRTVYYEGRYIGEWHWFLHREEFKNTTLHLIKGFYLGLIANPPPLEVYERTEGIAYVYPLKNIVMAGWLKRALGNYSFPKSISVLDNMTLPDSRLAVALAFFHDTCTPIYYDMITGIIVRIDLWRDMEHLHYADSILEKVFGINEFWCRSQPSKEFPPRPMHVYIKLVDTNIPLSRPTFGATGTICLAQSWNLTILMLSTAIIALLIPIIVFYIKRSRPRA